MCVCSLGTSGRTCTELINVVLMVGSRELNGWGTGVEIRNCHAYLFIVLIFKLLECIPSSVTYHWNICISNTEAIRRGRGVNGRGGQSPELPWWTCLGQGAGAENTGINTPSSARISNPRVLRQPRVSIQPCLCEQRNDFLKISTWRTCSGPKLTCVGKTLPKAFPNHWKNHTAVCGEKQGCVPEVKPNGGQRSWLDNWAEEASVII